MSFKENLIKARSHVVFLLAVVSAFGLVMNLDNMSSANVTGQNMVTAIDYTYSAEYPLAQHRKLTELEYQWAKIAWTYFDRNTNDATGLANSVDGYTATTIWDTASHLMALIAAERLAIIDQEQFNQRVQSVLTTLASLPLYNNQLPNKSYNTESAVMVDYANRQAPEGIGWSAIDISRLLVPLHALMWNHPHMAGLVSTITRQWDMSALVEGGELNGAIHTETGDGRVTLVQEGRLGYEEYAARALQLRGVTAEVALDYFNSIDYLDVYGAAIPVDSRSVEMLDAHNFVTSEPFILAALESGWDRTTREFASRIYEAQFRRYQDTGTLTAVTEDHLDRSPWFVYNSVVADGKRWAAMTEHGESNPEYRTLSTKASFAWNAIFDTDYTRLLVNHLSDAYDIDRGWYAGIYEAGSTANKAITANTNAVVLMALAYTQGGTLLRPLQL